MFAVQAADSPMDAWKRSRDGTGVVRQVVEAIGEVQRQSSSLSQRA